MKKCSILYLSYNANFMTQFKYLFWRSWLTNVRDTFGTQVAAIQTIVSYFNLFLAFVGNSE